jgi:outer membrane protein insertion porin family
LLFAVALSAASCKDTGDIQVKSLTFNGVKQVEASALKDALATKAGSKLPWGRKEYFDRQAFEADLMRITAFYRDRGFPDARVRSFDVKLNDAQDAVSIVVDISEGEPITVASIDLTGFDVLTDAQRRGLRSSLPLKTGQPLDRQLAVATRERALNVLKDAGYPYATVAMHPEDAGPRKEAIHLEATPGTLAHFGQIDIRGESSVGEDVIRRELTFKSGDKYTRADLRESQQKLYGLELFQFVNIESLEDKDFQMAVVPVRVTVGESKHQKVTTGLGYGSEEKARAQLRWDHVNFLGGARQLGFEGRWSSLDRGIRTDFTEPYLLSPKLSLRFEGQAWQAAEPAYSQNTVGGRAIVKHQNSAQTFWTVSLIDEYEHSTISNDALSDFSVRNNLIALGLDPRTGSTTGTLGAVAFEISRNTSNNLLDPRDGYMATAHVEDAGRLLWGTYRYFLATAEGRAYLPIGRTLVWANRVNVGAIDPAGNDSFNVPFHKRFFLGGASSVRGWGRFELSPLSTFGFPIGGLSMFEGSTEARVPLRGKLGAVAFLDFGNVDLDAWRFDLGNLRYAVGPGLRYLTPVGPARVDIGYQLNPEPGLLVNGKPETRRWRLHFSIGQAF